MKIAVTYEDGQVFQHFGHSQAFKVYELREGQVISGAVVPTSGSGHGALAGFLQELGVKALICGGIGGGARQALEQSGIALYAGVSGSADQAAQAFAAGALAYDPNAQCQHHHDHGEEHHCGHHEQGEECRHGRCL